MWPLNGPQRVLSWLLLGAHRIVGLYVGADLGGMCRIASASDFCHETDFIDFAPSYEYRRINMTQLYGWRGSVKYTH